MTRAEIQQRKLAREVRMWEMRQQGLKLREIAEAEGISVERVRQILRFHAWRTKVLERVMTYEERRTRAITREARVVALRALGSSLGAIAQVMGVSPARVRQLLRAHAGRCTTMGRLSIPKRMALHGRFYDLAGTSGAAPAVRDAGAVGPAR